MAVFNFLMRGVSKTMEPDFAAVKTWIVDASCIFGWKENFTMRTVEHWDQRGTFIHANSQNSCG